MVTKENMALQERTVHATLESKVNKYGDKKFLTFKGVEFGYAELNDLADRLACGLQRIGLSAGYKAAIMLPNRLEFLAILFALSKCGIIAVPINIAHKGELLRYLLDHSDSKAFFVESEYMPIIENIVDKTQLENIFVVGHCKKQGGHLNIRTWEEMLAFGTDYRPNIVSWLDPFCIIYTSGTTGVSKGVVLPHNYAVSLGEKFCELAKYSDKDCLYVTLPLFHGNALFLSIMPALIAGARVVLAERFSASRFWPDIRTHSCTATNVLSSILPILFKAEPNPEDVDNTLRVMISAGAPKNIINEFESRFGVTLIEVYGMTEIGIPMNCTFTERKIGSCGKPKGYSVKVIDKNGQALGSNATGELLVRPLNPYIQMLEYYKMPEKTIESWRDLWFHSGDYFYYDDDGYFYFVDRKKDAIRRRGENVSSYEVEKIINEHPMILESAAVAVESEMGEDEIMVCLTLKSNCKLRPQDLIQYCEKHMAYFMIPRYLRYMNQLPKTSTEKVMKTELRKEGITSDVWDRENG